MNWRSVQPSLIRGQAERGARREVEAAEVPADPLPVETRPTDGVPLETLPLETLPLDRQVEQLRAALMAATAENAALAEASRTALAEAAILRAQLVQAGKLASLGELVAGVAHEINNPLAFSLSHLGMLRRCLGKSQAAPGPQAAAQAPEISDEAERFDERLGAIGTGLERIRAVVAKLQTYCRKDDAKRSSIDVAEALGVVEAILEHRTREGITLVTDVGRPARVECDPSLFYQSVMNLVVNAIDAIDGEGEVRISAGAAGAEYILRVVDTGRGIPADLQERVFEPFFTTKPSGKGTGLGLSIAAAVVRSHGGSLVLRAAAGRGTEALIALPLEQVAPGFVP